VFDDAYSSSLRCSQILNADEFIQPAGRAGRQDTIGPQLANRKALGVARAAWFRNVKAGDLVKVYNDNASDVQIGGVFGRVSRTAKCILQNTAQQSPELAD
jgi:hypothetical protein